MQILVATLRGAVHQQQRAAAYAALLPSLVHTPQSRYFLNSRRILWANFLVLHLTIFELPYKLEVIVCRELPSENKGSAQGWQYGTVRWYGTVRLDFC